MSAKLGYLASSDVEFPENCLIGRGSFAECKRCWLMSDSNKAQLAVKIFKLESVNNEEPVLNWLLKHLVKEIQIMHKISHENKRFVKVLHTYSEDSKLVGYTMVYYRHGSLRLFSHKLSKLNLTFKYHPWLIALWMQQVAEAFEYLQRTPETGYLHRDMAIDNVLIDDDLEAKVADFGLSKRMVDSVATQLTFDFEKRRGIERRLPETYDNVLRQPDEFGDRYLYAVAVVEAFGQLSLREIIGDREEQFKLRVRQGIHLKDLTRLVDQACFEKISLNEANQQLQNLRAVVKDVIMKMAQAVPDTRATFGEVRVLWEGCDQSRMQSERTRVLTALANLDLEPTETLSLSEDKHTVSLGPVSEQGRVAVEHRQSQDANPVPTAANPTSQQQSTATGLFISIDTLGGDAHVFRPPECGGNADVIVSQAVGPPICSDVVQLLQRRFAEHLADEALLKELCLCGEVTSRWLFIARQLGCTEVDLQRLAEDSLGDGDRLFQALLRLSKNQHLTAMDIGEAFKKCGCISGLRILRQWEILNNYA